MTFKELLQKTQALGIGPEAEVIFKKLTFRTDDGQGARQVFELVPMKKEKEQKTKGQGGK